MNRPRFALVAVATALLLGVLPSVVRANGGRVADANDTKGPLDIKAASHGHDGARLIHRIKTHTDWSAGTLDDDSGFLVGFDTRGDRAFERCLIIVGGQKLSAVVTNCGKKFVASATVRKPNPQTVVAKFKQSAMGDIEDYGYKALSVYVGDSECQNGCIDKTTKEIHDLTSPEVVLWVWSPSSVAFSVPHDIYAAIEVADNLSVKSWKIQYRIDGTASWSTVKEGSGQTGYAAYPITGSAEGTDFDFRAIATDQGGNTTKTKIREVLVPYDDFNPTAGLLAFHGSWVEQNPWYAGSPCHPVVERTCGAYQNTQHWTNTVGDSLTVTFDGTGIVWTGHIGASPGAVGITVDGIDYGTVDLDTIEYYGDPVVLADIKNLPSGTHEALITLVEPGDAIGMAIDSIGIHT